MVRWVWHVRLHRVAILVFCEALIYFHNLCGMMAVLFVVGHGVVGITVACSRSRLHMLLTITSYQMLAGY